MKIHRYVTLLVILALPAVTSSAQRATSPPTAQATLKAVSAAKAFLATLDQGQCANVRLELNNKTRSNWSNLPTGATFQNGATERNRLKLGDMTAAQQQAALLLV